MDRLQVLITGFQNVRRTQTPLLEQCENKHGRLQDQQNLQDLLFQAIAGGGARILLLLKSLRWFPHFSGARVGARPTCWNRGARHESVPPLGPEGPDGRNNFSGPEKALSCLKKEIASAAKPQTRFGAASGYNREHVCFRPVGAGPWIPSVRMNPYPVPQHPIGATEQTCRHHCRREHPRVPSSGGAQRGTPKSRPPPLDVLHPSKADEARQRWRRKRRRKRHRGIMITT